MDQCVCEEKENMVFLKIHIHENKYIYEKFILIYLFTANIWEQYRIAILKTGPQGVQVNIRTVFISCSCTWTYSYVVFGSMSVKKKESLHSQTLSHTYNDCSAATHWYCKVWPAGFIRSRNAENNFALRNTPQKYKTYITQHTSSVYTNC